MKSYVNFMFVFWLCSAASAQDLSAHIDDYDPLSYENTLEKDTTLNYLNADSTWWSGLQLGLTFSQSSFTGNWTGGGVSAFAFNAIFSYQLHYQNETLSWDNQAEGLYGIIKNADQTYLRKSQDRIYLDSKLGYRVSEDWNIFLASNFLTQFAPGYNYEEDALGNESRILISDFMTPGFLTTSLGIEYRPNENFWLRLSPFSPRLTFVTNPNIQTEDNKNYGVDPGETVRQEWLAFQIVSEFQKNLTSIINLQTRYMFFANYDMFALNTVDHRIDLLLNAKLTRYISFNAGVIALYDFDQDEDIQISQTMGIGILLQN